MKSNLTSSLIITTYNWPEALELVLESVNKQIVLPNEVIIADDGSKKETKILIENFQKDFPIPLIHIWHKDEGFRRSAILNLAIAKTNSDYIIQLDGDCIIHKNFIKDHLSSLKKNTYLFGSRASLQEYLLPILFSDKVVSFSYFSKGLKKKNRNIYMPFLGTLIYKKNNKLSKKLRGCNLSYWRSDFLKVNGYNEDMVGWGREDSEFVVRMINSGIYGKRLKFKAIVYHIWHKESSKEKLDVNHTIQQKTIENKITWCANGIDKYLKNNREEN
jgi:glycosyltransferase involved in cell wall biosynthesis